MPKWIRIVVLLAAVMLGIFPGEDYGHQYGETIDFSWVAILFVLFAFCMILFGSVAVLLYGIRGSVARPSMAAPFFVGASPLQFAWFAGLIFTAVGAGFVVRGIWEGFDDNGFVFLSAGLGLFSGCRVVMILFRRRLVEPGRRALSR